MNRFLLAASAALLFVTSAFGQSVQQSGSVTPNTSPVWSGTGIIKGGNTATDSPLTTFGVTRESVDAFCVSSDRVTAAARNQLCFQASTTGPAKISLQNYGAAGAQNLQFVLNGVPLTLPSGGGTFVTGTGAFIVGHAACWNSTAGILQDCGVSVAPGTQFGLSYYSTSSTLGTTTAGGNGQFLLGQAGAVPLWTTLSGDAASVSAGGALTLSKVNGIPFGTSYTAHGVLLAQGANAFTSVITSNVGNCLLSQGTSSDPIWSSCASGSGSAGGSNTQLQFNNSTSLAGSANLTWATPALTIGVAGTTAGQLQLAPAGSATGTITLQNTSGTAAYNFNLPAAAGTAGQAMLSGGGGGTPMSFGTLTAAAGGTNCSVASGTCLDNITGFAATGFMNRTGAGTYSFSTTIPVSGGGTALANGTSGGILGFTGTGTIASSALLTQFGVVVGGGAGATPTAITPGTSAQLLLQQTSANPSWNSMSGDATISSSGALTVANSAITVGKQANAAGFSIEGNFTGSTAAPQFSTIAALSNKASPAAGDLIMISDQSAAGAIKQATISSIASAGSVSSIDTKTGAFTTAGGVQTSTNQIQADGKYVSLNAGSNCTIAASVGSNLLTVVLKDAGGNDPTATSPCSENYRDPTASTGATTLVVQTAALSVSTTNTAAAGAMGSSNNAAFRIWVVVFNNSGTNVLGLINCSNSTTIFPLNEGLVASSTPFSASSTSAGIFYTPSGITVSSKAFRILGYIEYNSTGLTTAGTYASGPNFIQNFGPGIKKPGDEVQVGFVAGTANNSSTSNAFGTGAAPANATTATIIPTSAANAIFAQFSGTGTTTPGTSNFLCQLFRGASGTVNTAVGNLAAGQASSVGVSLQAFEFPNVTSAIQYTQRVHNADNSTAVACPGTQAVGATSNMILKEIMG